MFKDFARLMADSAPEQADMQLLHSGHQLPTSRWDRDLLFESPTETRAEQYQAVQSLI
jgi:hypothetical protein